MIEIYYVIRINLDFPFQTSENDPAAATNGGTGAKTLEQA